MESISYPDDSSNFAQRALKMEFILIYFRISLTRGDTHYTVTPIPSICLCIKIKELEEYMIVRQENQISFDSFAMMMMMMMMLDQFRSQAWACQGQARYRGQFISGGNTRIGKNDDEPPL